MRLIAAALLIIAALAGCDNGGDEDDLEDLDEDDLEDLDE